jgi:hypothetical protein
MNRLSRAQRWLYGAGDIGILSGDLRGAQVAVEGYEARHGHRGASFDAAAQRPPLRAAEGAAS